MDSKTKASIEAKIRKDYGSLNDCVEYVATVMLCWGKTKFEEHKETLQHFLSLREKGQIPAYITPEDMKNWILSEGRNILRERFQIECADQRDGLIHLAWEVNMRLKMQDIFMQLGLTTSSSSPLSDHDFQQEALSDLQSSAWDETPFHRMISQYYFDADTVVRRAVREMIQQLARPPVARPHTVSELVVDTVTRLFRTVMDDGEEPMDRRPSSRFLSGVAVGTTVIVLQDVCAEERCAGAQELRVQYSHSTRASVVSTLHRELLEQTGSPEVLKAALRGKLGALNSTITSVITGVIINLLKPPVGNVLDAAAVENILYDAAAVENVLDAAAAVENILDAATAVENILDAAAAVEIVLDTAAVGNVLDAAAVENVLDAAAVENVLDAAAVENVLDAAAAVENIPDDAAVENVLDAAAAVENVLDAIAAVENVLDAAAVENVLDAAAAVENISDDAAVENIPDAAAEENILDAAAVDNVLVAAAVENVLDDAAVENVLDAAAAVENILDAAVAVGIVLDAATAVETDVVLLQEHQLEDLPLKVKKQRRGIRRFFSRMWGALRRSTFCCCCCESVETD